MVYFINILIKDHPNLSFDLFSDLLKEIAYRIIIPFAFRRKRLDLHVLRVTIFYKLSLEIQLFGKMISVHDCRNVAFKVS